MRSETEIHELITALNAATSEAPYPASLTAAQTVLTLRWVLGLDPGGGFVQMVDSAKRWSQVQREKN